MPKSVQCKRCFNYRNEWCAQVLDSPDPDMVRDCRYYATMTNADKVRRATDEELVDLWFFIYSKVIFNATDSRWGLLQWLKQEVHDADA